MLGLQQHDYLISHVRRNGKADNSPFKLQSDFMQQYADIEPAFGFNGLGKFVFYRTYSRIKDDGMKETFADCLQRVVEGCYEIQRRHCRAMHIPWTRSRAQVSAQEMFQRMWQFKFLPPGRGLWIMGTQFMWDRGSAALQNCAFISTESIGSDPSRAFGFMADMSMLGVGVGFDTRGAGKCCVCRPLDRVNTIVVHDSREGWVDSIKWLVESYTSKPELGHITYDYNSIRKAGSPIKSFGGKASGPDILIQLHAMIRVHLESVLTRSDHTLTSVDIVDLMNYIGRCVVAGNVRRSSQLALGEYDDADYIDMKNPDLHRAELGSHRWASNNSIFAKVGMDYSDVADRIAKNGEPGLVWLDNVQNYGRMADGRQEGIDKWAVGVNPCFAGNMRLFTAEGYRSLYDLWLSSGAQEYHGLSDNPIARYGKQDVVNQNGVVVATPVYRTGLNLPLYRVTLNDGSWIDATSNHEFITTTKVRNGRRWNYAEKRVCLSHLAIGDKLPLNQTTHFGTYHDPAYAELAGWCIGDGSLSPKQDGQVRAQCTCYEEDIIDVEPRLRGLLLEVYLAHAKTPSQLPAYAGWNREHKHFDHDEHIFGSNVLGRLLRQDGVAPGWKHKVPASVWGGTRETVAAFLRGLASADGYIHITDNGTIGVRIFQANHQLLLDCRLLLSQFNIASSAYYRRKPGKALMNDGKGGKKLYNRKAGWELVISGRKQVSAFLDSVGFIQPRKSADARLWLLQHPGSNNSNTGRYRIIKSIEYVGTGDTYCLTEPASHEVVVEGVRVAQCAEQSLEDAECCNLCETFPANHDNAADYHRTLKFAYLYAKTVTLLTTHCEDTNAVMLRNRRIGLSQSGIIQAFHKFGRRAVLRDFCDKAYEVVDQWDRIYSDWLCVCLSRKKTSIKPSGSISLVAGATAGIHYSLAPSWAYWRNVRVSNDSTLLVALRDAGYYIEPSCSDDKTSVVRFGVYDDRVPPISMISMWEQMKNAADYQKSWADNQVSVTIRFKPEEAKDIPFMLAAFDDELKAVSLLPLSDHGYKQAPYEESTPEQVAAYNASLKPLDFSKYIAEDAVGSKYCDGDSCALG